MTSYKQALDGAKAVRVNDDVGFPVIVVWHGGTTFNVYNHDYHDYEGLDNVDVFNVSDENGRPVDRETAVEHMNDYLDRET